MTKNPSRAILQMVWGVATYLMCIVLRHVGVILFGFLVPIVYWSYIIFQLCVALTTLRWHIDKKSILKYGIPFNKLWSLEVHSSDSLIEYKCSLNSIHYWVWSSWYTLTMWSKLLYIHIYISLQWLFLVLTSPCTDQI